MSTIFNHKKNFSNNFNSNKNDSNEISMKRNASLKTMINFSSNKKNIQIFEKNNKISSKELIFPLKKDYKKTFTIDNLKIAVEKYTTPTSPVLSNTTKYIEKSTTGRKSCLSLLNTSENEKRYFSPKNNLLNKNKILIEINKLREGSISKNNTYCNLSSYGKSKTLQTINSTIIALNSPRSLNTNNLIKPGFIKNDFISDKRNKIFNKFKTDTISVSKTFNNFDLQKNEYKVFK